MKLLNKYKNFLFGGTGSQIEYVQIDYLYFKKSGYIKLAGFLDTYFTGFYIEYNPIKLVTSYQCYLGSIQDNFTFAYYTNSHNYLRVRGSQIAINIRTPFNVKTIYEYSTGNNTFLGNSNNDIYINNNGGLSRGAEMKLYNLKLYGNTNYNFYPVKKTITGEIGLYDFNLDIFFPVNGEVEAE